MFRDVKSEIEIQNEVEYFEDDVNCGYVGVRIKGKGRPPILLLTFLFMSLVMVLIVSAMGENAALLLISIVCLYFAKGFYMLLNHICHGKTD